MIFDRMLADPCPTFDLIGPIICAGAMGVVGFFAQAYCGVCLFGFRRRIFDHRQEARDTVLNLFSQLTIYGMIIIQPVGLHWNRYNGGDDGYLLVRGEPLPGEPDGCFKGALQAMKVRIFKGFEDIYPERIDETDSWYYAQWTPCSEAYEVVGYKNRYPGTRLYLIQYPSGKMFEPVRQEKNVFLERPVYEHKDNSFGIIRYDFNKEIVQALIFKPECAGAEVLAETTFAKVGDMINVRLIISPFALVKYDVQRDMVDFLWPKEMTFNSKKMRACIFRMAGNCIHQNGSRIRIIGKKPLLGMQKPGRSLRGALDIYEECRTVLYGR